MNLLLPVLSNCWKNDCSLRTTTTPFLLNSSFWPASQILFFLDIFSASGFGERRLLLLTGLDSRKQNQDELKAKLNWGLAVPIYQTSFKKSFIKSVESKVYDLTQHTFVTNNHDAHFSSIFLNRILLNSFIVVCFHYAFIFIHSRRWYFRLCHAGGWMETGWFAGHRSWTKNRNRLLTKVTKTAKLESRSVEHRAGEKVQIWW